MRTIAHLSDLHFGRVEETAAQELTRQIGELEPDVVVVSGDLTQRARTSQFQAARRFLDLLPQPQLVVPGNHDVPAYNLLTRFFEPLTKYRLNITRDLLPSYVDGEMALIGMNSTRSLTTKSGKLREQDIVHVCQELRKLPQKIIRIVVSHHPFDVPPNHGPRDLIRNSSDAMRAFAECNVDVILSGHLHLGHISRTTERYRIPGHSALIVQAGTAISNRYRGEMNSFNILRVQEASITVEKWVWEIGVSSYAPVRTENFARTPGGWLPASP